ncbi:hypothetical protein MMC16_005762 [Acarospora aff. strigata]|nr:hypothetical protein [Acarospora aff. strigata]
MSFSTTVTRISPVKLIPERPGYTQTPTLFSPVQEISCFREIKPGFGSRHIADDAPFTLRDSTNSDFRIPTDAEWAWLSNRFDADKIIFEFPDIIITTNAPPPQPIPLTIAGCLVRFIPPDIALPTVLPLGRFKPYSTAKRDIFPFLLPKFRFPTLDQRSTIVDTLQEEVNIRAVHFVPPLIIVELSVTDGRKYEYKTLPGKAGGLNIMYHHGEESFWSESREASYARLITPTATANDTTNYLYTEPFKLSPGVCVSSVACARGTAWLSTSAGILIQRGAERRLTLANHGFQHSDEVFHPDPTSGRRIGQIRLRLPPHDLALAELDPSITFDNQRYFEAPNPQRLVDHTTIQAGDWFECDGMSTGRIDLCARSLGASYPNKDSQPDLKIPYRNWEIDLHFSAFGILGANVQDGICGAPLVDGNGRVAGMFRSVDDAGIFASTASMDLLIREGWAVI